MWFSAYLQICIRIYRWRMFNFRACSRLQEDVRAVRRTSGRLQHQSGVKWCLDTEAATPTAAGSVCRLWVSQIFSLFLITKKSSVKKLVLKKLLFFINNLVVVCSDSGTDLLSTIWSVDVHSEHRPTSGLPTDHINVLRQVTTRPYQSYMNRDLLSLGAVTVRI